MDLDSKLKQRDVESMSHDRSVLPTVVTRVTGSPTPFTHSLGAWSKPLKIVSPSTSPVFSSILKEADTSLIQNPPSPTSWPSLAAGQSNGVRTRATKENRSKASAVSKSPVQNIYSPEVRKDGKLRFPWAAKMDPSKRNLYRTTSPTYLEDGTPKVTIPSHILLHGPANQKEYIIGQFYRCSTPSGGLIHAVVNRIWGRKCRIFIQKLGESSYLFHIPDESTRSWILQRGLWHVDDCLMFVASWTPEASLSLPEISTIPVWVTLKNIPSMCYSELGISQIASGLGEPMLTNKPRLDPTLMGEAKIMVEVELDKPFPQRIACDDKKGTISMVDVEYSWIPIKCDRCGHLGHKKTRCLTPSVKDMPPASGHQASVSVDPISVEVEAVHDPANISVSDPASAIANISVVPVSSDSTATFPVQVIDCVAANETASEEISKDEFVTDSDCYVVVPESEVVAAPVAEILVTLEAPIIPIIVAEEMSSEPSDVDHTPHGTSTSEVTIPSTSTNEGMMSSPVLPEATFISEDIDAITQCGELVKGTTVENDLSKSRFKLLGFSVSDEDTDGSDSEACMFDTMTPSSQRLLRERPVKPSFKALEMQASSKARGRGSRGRGNQGGRG